MNQEQTYAKHNFIPKGLHLRPNNNFLCPNEYSTKSLRLVSIKLSHCFEASGISLSWQQYGDGMDLLLLHNQHSCCLR